jgi:hypothetical protein
MRSTLAVVGLAVLLLTLVPIAQQKPDPRNQPGAPITVYAPEQHDLYDGHFVLPANRIYMVGGLTDPAGWGHRDTPEDSPQQNPKNTPNREVFMHFFGMEITWK